jgi:hypothetical protein
MSSMGSTGGLHWSRLYTVPQKRKFVSVCVPSPPPPHSVVMVLSMQEYTAYDATFDIVLWQVPVALVVALLGVCYILMTHNALPIPPIWNVNRACFLLGYITTCWLSSVMVFLCLDMLILPPLFAMHRLSQM